MDSFTTISERLKNMANFYEQRRKAVQKVNDKINTELQRTRKLLSESYEILKFTMCVPLLVENDYYLVENLLEPSELETIKSLFANISFTTTSLLFAGDYVKRHTNFFTASSASSVEKFYTEYHDYKTTVQYDKEIEDVWTAVHILWSSAPIRRIADNELYSKVNTHNQELVSYFKQLFDYIEKQMNVSPSAAEWQELELCTKYLESEELNNYVHLLSTSLEPRLTSNSLSVCEGTQHIESLLNKEERLAEYVAETFHKYTSEAKKQMIFEVKESEKRQEDLVKAKEGMEDKYEKLLAKNTVEEKQLRIKKYKTQQQLNAIWQKHTSEMTDRNEKYTEIANLYETEQKQLYHLQVRFEEQEKLYNELMKEKLEYDQSVWEEKIRRIQENIAARQIQRYYRAYQAVLAAHGKKKKKAKGKGKRR